MKTTDFRSSLDLALPILSSNGSRVGRLVPVGEWAIADRAMVEAMTAWRARWVPMFLSQFEPTAERTSEYLRNLAIAAPDRLLFLIYDADEVMIGHTGFVNVDGRYGELDNVVRGVSGGHARLVYFAAVAQLDWGFRSLGLSAAAGRVMSYNRPIIGLLKQTGFSLAEEFFLFKRQAADATVHDIVEQGASNVDYRVLKMRIDRDRFYEKQSWVRQ